MSKYIPADKLIAEIEALKRRRGFLPLGNTEITEAYMARGIQFACDDIVNLITSLQQEQPEVDLEKEVQRWKNKHGVVGMNDLWLKFALDIYELGLNARKEETK